MSRVRTPSPTVLALFAPSLLALAALAPRLAGASGGDFSNFNWSASAPDTYDHDVGGGAFNDGTTNFDIVESLLGGDFACGDVVTYLVKIPVGANACGAQTIEFEAGFLANTTGQRGSGHVEVLGVQVNYGAVANGAGPNGEDSGIVDDGGSVARLVQGYLTGPPYQGSSELRARVQVDDLEAGETVIVRIDTRLGCDAGTGPTGNLQGGLLEAAVISAAPESCVDWSGTTDTINAGNQTIPFKQIGDLLGAGEPLPRLFKTVTTEEGSCPGQETLDAAVGDAARFCYSLSNDGTDPLYNVALNDDNATPEDPSDDFTVLLAGLLDLDGDGLSDDLAANATATGTALVEVTAAGSATNLATATGLDGGASPSTYSDTDTATVVATAPPAALSIETLASPDADCSDDDNAETVAVPDGEPVYWCYTVTNEGADTVTGITVVDDTTSVSQGISSLAPGESAVIASDAYYPSADTTTSAEALGTDSAGGAVLSDPDGASVLVVDSALALTMTASLDEVCGNSDDTDLAVVLEGAEVTLCYTLTNIGSEPVSDIVVSDLDATVPGTADLLPGESVTLASLPVLVTADGTFEAIADGVDDYGYSVSSNTDTAAVDVVAPALTVFTTASLDGSCPGDEGVQVREGEGVTTCVEVVNTGDTALSGVEVVLDDGTVLLVGDLGVGGSSTVFSDGVYTDDATLAASASASVPATGTTVESDLDDAAVDVVFPVLKVDVTVSDDGSCPGEEVLTTLTDTDLTWCYTVTNDGDVAISGITVTDDLQGVIDQPAFSLGVGESYTLSLSDVSTDDLVLQAYAAGTDDATGGAVTSALDPAVLSVVFPGFELDKTVSLDGACPGVDSAAVPAGEEVVYCLEVVNTGDTTLTDVTVTDAQIGLVEEYVGAIAPGESVTFSSGWVAVAGDSINTAEARVTDQYGYVQTDSDSVSVDALYADIAVALSAPDLVVSADTDAVSWTIDVWSEGETSASDSVLTFPIPDGVSIDSAISSVGTCTIAEDTVICALGDLGVGDAVTIVVSGTTDLAIGVIEAAAFVATASEEEDLADNSDAATTRVAPGVTRTIGFWGQHPTFLQQCLDASGTINLGFTQVGDESADDEIDVDSDASAESALELGMGVLKARVSRKTDNSRRTPVEQARMQTGRQVLAAWCNETLLGADAGIDFPAAATTLAGTDIEAILALGHFADTFNNSDTEGSLGVDPGRANGRFAWDDPTDAND